MSDVRVYLPLTPDQVHDVATHGEFPFLFWLQVDGATTSLWAMRMCVP